MEYISHESIHYNLPVYIANNQVVYFCEILQVIISRVQAKVK